MTSRNYVIILAHFLTPLATVNASKKKQKISCSLLAFLLGQREKLKRTGLIYRPIRRRQNNGYIELME
jgi:hypothetical protein